MKSIVQQRKKENIKDRNDKESIKSKLYKQEAEKRKDILLQSQSLQDPIW